MNTAATDVAQLAFRQQVTASRGLEEAREGEHGCHDPGLPTSCTARSPRGLGGSEAEILPIQNSEEPRDMILKNARIPLWMADKR